MSLMVTQHVTWRHSGLLLGFASDTFSFRRLQTRSTAVHTPSSLFTLVSVHRTGLMGLAEAAEEHGRLICFTCYTARRNPRLRPEEQGEDQLKRGTRAAFRSPGGWKTPGRKQLTRASEPVGPV